MIGCPSRRLAQYALDNRGLAEDSIAAVTAAATAPPAVYSRPEEFIPVPLLVSRRDWAAVSSACTSTVRLVAGAVDRLLDGHPHPGRVLGTEHSRVVQARAEGLARLAPLLARPDTLVGGDGAIVVEANIDSALGGLGTADALASRVASSELVRRFAQDTGITLTQPPGVTKALARLILERSPTGRPPWLAIVDWADEIDEVPWPYERLAAGLASEGIGSSVLPPEAMTWDGRTLRSEADGRAIDVVYRGVMPDERYWADISPLEPVMAAWRAGRVSVLTPPASVMWSSKRLLAWLSEAADTGELPAPEAAAVRALIPWTRLLEDGLTTRGADKVDLLPWAVDNQQRLVVKDAFGSCGTQVTIGREVSEAEWVDRLSSAAAEGAAAIQDFIDPPVARLPHVGPGGLELVDSWWNASAFVVDGRSVGSCVRAVPVGGALRISCTRGAREGVVVLTP